MIALYHLFARARSDRLSPGCAGHAHRDRRVRAPGCPARRPRREPTPPRAAGNEARRIRRTDHVGRTRLAARRCRRLSPSLGRPTGRALIPGRRCETCFNATAPCVILIDEWVAYARQLYADDSLPAGTFDTHFSFAQALTEAARAVEGALLVVSIPASESAGTEIGSDIEVGGVGGRDALRRLRAIVGRMESSWRPASADESFEIVRRRLFRPLEASTLAARDATCLAFGDYYRAERGRVPSRLPRARLRRAYEGRVPDPSRAVRPPLRGLVVPRAIPAHPRRSTVDGRK